MSFKQIGKDQICIIMIPAVLWKGDKNEPRKTK